MKRIFVVLISISLLLSSATFVYTFFFKSGPKTCYIEYEKVYNSFSFKAVLEKQFSQISSSKTNVLDSMKYALNVYASKNGTESKTFQEMVDNYYSIEEKTNSDLENIKGNYSQQIISLLQEYISDYALKNDFVYVFGQTSTQNVVYGDQSLNKTEEVITYINSRYLDDYGK